MPSHSSSHPINHHWPLRPSRALSSAVAFIHLLAALAVCLTSWIWLVKGLALIALTLHAIWVIARYYQHFPATAVGYGPKGWWCEHASSVDSAQTMLASRCPIQIHPSTWLSRYCVSLHWREEGSKRRSAVLIPVWHCTPSEFRALHRALRLFS